MHTIYELAKTLHIMGFIIAIGVTLSTFIAYKQFWKLYAINIEHGKAAFRTFKVLQMIGLLGLVAVLIGGITMLAIVDWSFIQLLWFQIKLGLVVLIFVNGFTLGRTSTLQLQYFLTKNPDEAELNSMVEQLRKRLTIFQVIQLCIYTLIILLSVFRIS